jgi:hypothetical protein
MLFAPQFDDTCDGADMLMLSQLLFLPLMLRLLLLLDAMKLLLLLLLFMLPLMMLYVDEIIVVTAISAAIDDVVC